MRVIYDTATGRVLALGDAVEPDTSAGQAVADLTPKESAEFTLAAAAVTMLGMQLRTASTEYEAATAAYRLAADAQRAAFATAELAARRADGVIGYDPARGFVTVAAVPVPDPTPEEDAAVVAADPKLSALLRVLGRQGAGAGVVAAQTSGRKS